MCAAQNIPTRPRAPDWEYLQPERRYHHSKGKNFPHHFFKVGKGTSVFCVLDVLLPSRAIRRAMVL